MTADSTDDVCPASADPCTVTGVVDVADGKCQVREEAIPQPDVTVTMAANDYVALSRGKLDPIPAFMGGKIKVTGNVGLMMQLLQWFKRG